MKMNRLFLTFPATIFLASIVRVRSSCDPRNPLLCPPQFPDFMAIFAETLDIIPGLRLEIENLQSTDDNCPRSVNWTDFNGRLASGNPVPLNVTCSLTTRSTTSYRTSPGSGTSAGPPIGLPKTEEPPPFDQSTNSTLETPESVSERSDRSQLIGLAVGLPLGAILILALIATVLLYRNSKSYRCRKKDPVLDRTVSTTSQAPLVTSDCTQPTTPGTDLPYNSVIVYNISSDDIEKRVYLEGSTFQDSSTDPTLSRSKGVAIAEKITMKTEEIRSHGKENKGFDAVGEELDDAGYAGSEVGQEIWENEMNILFESAKMDSSEDVVQVEPNKQQMGTDSGSLVKDQSSHFLEPTLSKRSRALFNLPTSTKLTSLKLNLPSPVLEQSSPTKSSTSPQLPSSPTKPLSSPQLTSSLAKPPMSAHLPSSSVKPPTSPLNYLFPSSDYQDFTTLTKPSFDPQSPPTPLSPEAPPAYSSPIYQPTESGPVYETEPLEAAPPGTPSELPTYSQVVACMAIVANTASGTVSSAPLSEASSFRRQQRPTPPPKVSFGGKPGTLRTPATQQDESTLKGSDKRSRAESRPSTLRKPPPIENHVYENSRPLKSSSGQTGEQRRTPNTAVIKPRIKGTVSNTDTKAAPASVDSTSLEPSNTPALPSGESVVDYSFRPVRSLLSQFEAVDRS